MRNSRRHRSKAQDAELGATKLNASRPFQSFSIDRANQRPFKRGLSLAASTRLITT